MRPKFAGNASHVQDANCFPAALAGVLVAGSASAQVLIVTPGCGYAYTLAYVVPAYPAAPAYVAPVAPAPSFAYVAPAGAAYV
jgi:hypothetical protein